jgi:hypothetical protein
MAAGNTATIAVTAFRAQWVAHVPIRSLCQNFSVTRDQVTRLKFVWHLPPRHDRRLRAKPERQAPPTPEEVEASKASLSLSPAIAARVTCVQATWDDRTRAERSVVKPPVFQMRPVQIPDEARDLFDDLNRESQW